MATTRPITTTRVKKPPNSTMTVSSEAVPKKAALRDGMMNMRPMAAAMKSQRCGAWRMRAARMVLQMANESPSC